MRKVTLLFCAFAIIGCGGAEEEEPLAPAEALGKADNAYGYGRMSCARRPRLHVYDAFPRAGSTIDPASAHAQLLLKFYSTPDNGRLSFTWSSNGKTCTARETFRLGQEKAGSYRVQACLKPDNNSMVSVTARVETECGPAVASVRYRAGGVFGGWY